MAKANSSLTIVDLLDTATYIYYAQKGESGDLTDPHALLLLHGETIEDSSQYKVPLVNNGVVVSSTQSKFGKGSLYFDGISSLSAMIDLFSPVINKSYTIDFWEYRENDGVSLCLNQLDAQGFSSWYIDFQNSLYSAYQGGSWGAIAGGKYQVLKKNTWEHHALVKDGNQVRYYLDGKKVFSQILPKAYSGGNNQLTIGNLPHNANFALKGYITEFRISDIPRWTSDFTPPIRKNKKEYFNISSQPSPERKYIGIYNGPALPGGQPTTPPEGTEWFKYLGDDGESAPKTQAQYGETQDGPWESIFQNGRHSYLRFSYDGGKTWGDPIRVAGERGEDGKTFQIISNQEEVLKFITEEKVVFTPTVLRFQVFELRNKQQVQLKDYQYRLGLISPTGEIYSITDHLKQEAGIVTFEIDNFCKEDYSAIAEKKKVQDLLLQTNVFLKFSLVENNTEQAVKPISCQFGTTEDMAKFGLYSTGIMAAIQNTKLSFTADGLAIQNGGFSIQNNEGDSVLSMDARGNLSLQNVTAQSGYFQGVVEATDGHFSGIIEARGGRFLGLVQVGTAQTGIAIDGENGQIRSSNYSDSNSTGFALKADGVIHANSAILGKNVAIKEHLRIGENCLIANPLINNNAFIKITDLSNKERTLVEVNAMGELILGNKREIVLDGAGAQIYSTHSSLGWSINAEKAEFNNIVARGTISCAVLSKGDIQTIGGILLVRPSTIIKKCYKQGEFYLIIPQTPGSGINVGHYCEIGGSNWIYKVITVDASLGEETITLVPVVEKAARMAEVPKVEIPLYEGKILVSFGTESDAIGIAINSSDNAAGALPHAITVFQSEFTEYGRVQKNRIILGEMNGDPQYGGLKGYGLYADNVYLKGALIAASEEGSPASVQYYSGINTSSGVKMPNENKEYFPEIDDTGDILFWAGAKDSTSSGIAASPFKVDTFGNLYANSGYFEGTIISNATISAAKIRTATLEGWDPDTKGKAALDIIDTDEAIRFKDLAGKEVINVRSSLISLNTTTKMGDRTFIYPDNGLICSSMIASVDRPDSPNESQYTTQLRPGRIKLTSAKDTFYIELSERAAHISVENQVLTLSDSSSEFYSELRCRENLVLGGSVEYKKIKRGQNVVGYDIYIKE